MYHCFTGEPLHQILDLFGPVLDAGGNWSARGKPAEAGLNWKPNAHKCRDPGSNPGLIGPKRGKIRCANPLPLTWFQVDKFEGTLYHENNGSAT